MSAWNCIEYDDLTKYAKGKTEPIKYKKCYYRIYGDSSDAKRNALDANKKVTDMKDFYLVTFESTPYYDRTSFLLFVGFCFIPFLLFTHFCWIPYAANKFEPYFVGFFSCRNCCRRKSESPK